MKCWLIFTLLCLFAFVNGIQGRAYSQAYGTHVEQHQQSVQAGKKSVEERLGAGASISTSSSLQSGGSFVDCALCTSGGYQQHNAEYGVGHGLVNLDAGSSQQLSSSSSSSRLSHLNNNYVTIPVVTGGGKSESYQEAQRHFESHSKANPTILIAPSGGSKSFHSSSENLVEVQKTIPTFSYTPVSSGFAESHSSESQKYMQSQLPSATYVVAPSGGSSSYQHHEAGSHSSIQQAVPIISYSPSSSSRSHHMESQKIVESQQAIPVFTYSPSSSSHSEKHESQKLVESHNAAPLLVQSPSTSLDVFGSSNEHSSKYFANHPSIYYTPTATGGSSFSSEYNSKLLKSSQATPSIALAPSYGLTLGGLSSSSSSFNSGSSLSSHHLGLGSHHSNLDEYMSESERLARLQSQSVQPGGIRTGGSIVNGAYGSSQLGLGTSANLATSSGLGGGYKKSQSWEKSSKWASGSEFGTDGAPKNYNLLSTAESEQHDINGKHAGYKAATTTLDDNGKVSTYTIHTP